MNKQDIQTVLNALQNSQLFVQASSNINVLEGFGQQLDDADEAIAILTAALAEPSEPVSDLVERLQLGDGSSPDHALLLEAANAIEHLIGELRKGLKQEEILENKLFKEIHKSTPDPVAYLVLFEGAGKLLEFTKGNYLHGAKVEHIPLFTHPAPSKPEPDKDLIQALTERDEYHDMADKLAEGIGLHFDGDIGEHSSSNSPWDRALDLLDSAACAETMRLTRPAKPEPSEPKPYCCYCESDNEGIRSTYFDQTCEGCVKRMTHPAPRPEPVATVQRINGITIGYLDVMQPVGTKLYTHTEPKPEPLRDDEVGDIARGMNIEITQDNEDTLLDFARAVEQAVISRIKP